MKKKVSILILSVMILSLVLGLAACSNDNIVISFVTSGGSKIDEVSVDKGQIPNIDEIIPTKNGYKFAGWFTDEALTVAFDKENMPKKSFTLYAKWETLKDYTIKFDSNGGETLQDRKFREDMNTNIEQYIPRRTDYEFAGWYLDKELNKPYKDGKLTSDLTLYAKWVDSEYSNVIFITNGGSFVDTLMFKRTEKPDLSNKRSSKKSHIFEGWYFDKEFTRPYVAAEAPNHTFNVYAKFRFTKSREEFIESIKKSLSEYNLDKGFNIDLNLDMGFDFELASKDQYNWDYNVVLKGNIFNENIKGNNDLEFLITDNKNNNAVIFGLTNINNELYIVLNNGNYKLSGFNLASLLTQTMMMELLPEGADLGNLNIIDQLKVNDIVDYLNLALIFTNSQGMTLSWIDNTYTIDIVLGDFIGGMVDFVKNVGIQLPVEVDNLVNSLKTQNLALNFVIKEDENAIFKDIKFDVVLANKENSENNGKLTTNSKLNIAKVNENLELTAPENAIDVNLLKHSVTTSFDLKDVNGNSLAKYDFVFKMEFEQTNMQEAIIQAVRENSAAPIIKAIFTGQDGKIYIDLLHNCDSTCKLGHLDNKKNVNKGAVLSLAYDPSLEGFDNNKIYVAIQLKKVASAQLLSVLPDIVAGAVKILINGTDYVVASFDMNNILTIEGLSKLPPQEVAPPVDPNPGTPEEGQTQSPSIVDGVVNILTAVIDGVNSTNGNWNIDFDSIWNAIQTIIPQDKIDLAKGIVQGLVPNVVTITGTKPVYSNTEIFDPSFNIKAAFLEEADGVAKIFKGIDSPVTLPVGEVNVVTKEDGKIDLRTKYNLYDLEGNIRLTTEEVYALVNEHAKVGMRYIDTNGSEVLSTGILMDIRGIDLDLLGVPQQVTFVFGRGAGDNLIDLLADIGGLANVAALKNLAFPQALLQVDIILDELDVNEGNLWTQKDVATPGMAFMFNKEYQKQDTFNIVYKLVRTYKSGAVKEIIIVPDDSSNLTSVEPNASQIKYYADFDLTYTYVDTKLTLHVKVKDYAVSGVFTGTVGTPLKVSGSIHSEELNEDIKLAVKNESLVSALKGLAASSQDKIIYEQNGFPLANKLTFKEAGNYSIICNINGVEVTLAFNITAQQ